jgi:broad specificity phosphatase PhoE
MHPGNRRVQGLLSVLFSSSHLLGTVSSFRSATPVHNHRHLLATRLFESTSSKTATTTTNQGVMVNQVVPALPPLAPTAKRLFLVRHGEVINPGGDRTVFYGGMDVPLSPLGEQEAQAAADYLSQFDIARVFSSPLSRAMYGANQVLQKQQAKKGASSSEGASSSSSSSAPSAVVVLDGFTELDRGTWCGLTKEEIGSDLLARFDACDESVTPDGGESYPALKRRVLAARDEALSQVAPGTVGCLVSHLQVTRSILSEALTMPTEEMVNLKIATASVTCIDYDGPTQTVQFQSFKPNAGLRASKDGAN